MASKSCVCIVVYGDNTEEERADVDVDVDVVDGVAKEEPSGELRHTGQDAFILSHLSMHSTWK